MGRHASSSSASSSPDVNHYDVLGVSPDASNLEIKKAYRRLALLHHPDRNNGSPESTEKFQRVGEAFQCLSHPAQRRDYDAGLRGGVRQPSFATGSEFTSPSSSSPNMGASGRSPFAGQSPDVHHVPWGGPPAYRPNAGFDARAQFDRLFREDPFFQAAFKDMDEEFARRFRGDETGRAPSAAPPTSAGGGATAPSPPGHGARSREGWLPWLLRICGIELHMTTYSADGRGGTTRSSYSSAGRAVYTQKTSESHRDGQGRLVTVQRMEQNGNQIEDRLVNNRLVQRKINGVTEPLERIAEW